jgi:hypothetical protein
MIELRDIDLRSDPLARGYEKRETVEVEFATVDGALLSKVGPNHYRCGDALVSGADGDRWCVARDRFDRAYAALGPTVSGADGRYQNVPRPVLARQIPDAFRCQRNISGDWLNGNAGDWLLQYAPGDLGIASAQRFARVYRSLG